MARLPSLRQTVLSSATLDSCPDMQRLSLTLGLDCEFTLLSTVSAQRTASTLTQQYLLVAPVVKPHYLCYLLQ